MKATQSGTNFPSFVDGHRAQRLHQTLLAAAAAAVIVATIHMAIAMLSRMLLALVIIHVATSSKSRGLNCICSQTATLDFNDETAFLVSLERPLLRTKAAVQNG